MHVFFDTVWKLHIGEIPEKPKYRNFEKVGRITLHDTKKYNEAIAAIKQNALTVQNPEILKQFGYLELPINGDFVKWPGGADILEKIPPVAILTLSEEKKNTMENMTEKYLAIKMANRALEVPNADPDSDICTISRQFLRALESTASGSVAAPKPKTEGRWFKDWKKITEAVIPKGPMCRDCADEDGTCPNNDGLPCDPTDEVIERFKRLRQQLKEREEALKELLPIAERGHVYLESSKYYLYMDTISRAKALLDKH